MVTNTKEKKSSDEYKYDFANDVGPSGNGTITEAKTNNKDWLDEEDFSGQLAVDVYQSKDDIIIKSTIAGVKPEEIDISINNDMITIRGKREKEHEVEEGDYFYRECYWGGFSRSIILPCEVKIDKINATIKNGVLTITLPKATKVNKVTVVKVQEE
ncbi:Hsp20/alpha crystallin family protein [Patescibacteria group bacterium]|nr:Hsp20/alpha crystallin family protein [Patescibacteria group bacterium]